MKILVFGSKGQLGQCLNDQFTETQHDIVFISRELLDITNFEATKAKIIKVSPDILINATAYTKVDKAEIEEEQANIINNLAVSNIAKACRQVKCWFLHISTDYVFDGDTNIPYRECDQTNPQGVYGKTKLKGEEAIQASGCKYLIIRTSWLYSEYGNNYLKNMLSLGSERDQLSIVSDQIGCPTYAQDIARAIVKILPQLSTKKDYGLYHYCGEMPCSWYDFTKEIFKHAKANNLKSPSLINSIMTSDYPTLAKRPAFSALDCSKIKNDFGVSTSNWEYGIRQVFSKLKIQRSYNVRV